MVQWVLGLQPQVVRHGINGQRDAALDHDVTDDQVVRRRGGGGNHHEHSYERKTQSRHAPRLWVTMALSLISTTGRSSSTHMLSVTASLLRFWMR